MTQASHTFPEKIHFIDLEAQRRRLGAPLEEAILRSVRNGQYILGTDMVELERQLAAYTGSPHVVSCANGTDALLMVLMALNVGPGDAVFVPTFTFCATAEVVALTGATPVFVDIHADTYNMDPESLKAAIMHVKKRTSLRPCGVIPVDMFGQSADYTTLSAIAQENNLWVMADGAQSFGAQHKGTSVFNVTPFATTSFFPAKVLGGYGDGGAIFVKDEEVRDRLLSIRMHGMGTDRYEYVRIGLNGRLDTLQAAILLEKLKIFDDELAQRTKVAERYTALLSSHVQTPVLAPNCTSSWGYYTIQVQARDALKEFLAQRQIPSNIYYPIPLHQQKIYREKGLTPGPLPVAERLAQRVLSLPIHPYLTHAMQDYITQAVIDSVKVNENAA